MPGARVCQGKQGAGMDAALPGKVMSFKVQPGSDLPRIGKRKAHSQVIKKIACALGFEVIFCWIV
jgi:hypothetical protein